MLFACAWPERVDERFPPDPVYFIPKHRVQGPPLAIDDNAKADWFALVFAGEHFVMDARQRLLEIERGAVRGAQARTAFRPSSITWLIN